MEKLAHFFIDDTIWCLRDLARQKPKSIYDIPFFKMLKNGHDDYGMTVQLNLFYRTDFFYGNDEFTLKEVPDTYKDEFKSAKSWLRFAFHAKQEFPDYPYVNATYGDVKNNYEAITNEIKRLAGEECLASAIVTHWLPMSKEGCRALADCGAKFISCSSGNRTNFSGDASVLPYGHAARLMQNRQPETMLFTRDINDEKIACSLCAHNHIDQSQYDEIKTKNASILDKETGLMFKEMGYGPCLNLYDQEGIKKRLAELNGCEFIGTGVHEQYFYSDYYNHIPDYDERYYLLGKILKEYGYRFITADEMK